LGVLPFREDSGKGPLRVWTEEGGVPPRDSARPKNRKTMKEKILNFFRDIVKEMEKVTWPTKEELYESTKIVIVVTIIISLFTWVVDTALSEVLKAIL
jgi:preprotein translocase subunit SecE